VALLKPRYNVGVRALLIFVVVVVGGCVSEWKLGDWIPRSDLDRAVTYSLPIDARPFRFDGVYEQHPIHVEGAEMWESLYASNKLAAVMLNVRFNGTGPIAPMTDADYDAIRRDYVVEHVRVVRFERTTISGLPGYVVELDYDGGFWRGHAREIVRAAFGARALYMSIVGFSGSVNAGPNRAFAARVASSIVIHDVPATTGVAISGRALVSAMLAGPAS